MDTQSVDEGTRVLVVDDMRINIMVLSAKLKKLNYRCEGAESAARALELITTFKPDIILTDLWMPEMNGDVLAKKIRELPDYTKRPIFVVTADMSNQTGFDMSVFTGVLQKPIDDALLQKLLASAASSS
jgi:CheY-like chemotaxis protein